MTKQTRFNLWYAIIAIFVAMMIHNAWTSYRQVAVIPYSQFQDLLAAGKVKEVGVSEN